MEVQVLDGSVLSGIFHATNAERDFGMSLNFESVYRYLICYVFIVGAGL